MHLAKDRNSPDEALLTEPGSSYVPEEACDLEPIAVVGLSCNFAQEAADAEGFWNLIASGKNAMTDFPKDRMDTDGFYNSDGQRHDSMPVRGAHFLRDPIDVFDAPFFSITPAEAACMDPQQRGILEQAYRALENAGVTLDRCAGTQTSVHIGSFTQDYKDMLCQDPETETRYAASGVSSSMIANRVSWFFDFKGPSMHVDTACSSSLTALHLACQELREGSTSMSLVGGCNLIFHPHFMSMMANMSFLSPDSRCWSFDSRANGYARGEGFGMLVLKRLSDAARDGDTVRAVIRASGVNQDGRTPGITVPSGESQKQLIGDTFKRANLSMGPVRFFEAHGTGTQVGDPIETNAIGESFRSVRTPNDPLYVGAVKSNIGHAEGASGLAGLIKAILILERGIILPNTGFEKVNPRIRYKEHNLQFPLSPMPWPTVGLRRACVNSFGFGGSNSVVILDDACHSPAARGLRLHHRTRPAPPLSAVAPEDAMQVATEQITMKENTAQSLPHPKLLVWSANDETTTGALQKLLHDHLQKTNYSQETLHDFIYTVNARRSRFAWRGSAVLNGSDNLRSLLGAPISAEHVSGTRKLAFVFTGQGAQYAGMGASLLVYDPFRRSLQESGDVLKSLGCPWSLVDVMQDEGLPSIHSPDYSQPVCTALQIALVDLLRSLGLQATTVVGHSSGEIAAAYCTGALSRHSALKVAYFRGLLTASLQQETTTELTMMAVGTSEKVVRELLASEKNKDLKIDVACINSPKSVTISGDKKDIVTFGNELVSGSIFTRQLKVTAAYHSRFMEPIADRYTKALGDLVAGPLGSSPSCDMVSSVTGEKVAPEELRQSGYWTRNMVNPVQFSRSVSRLVSQPASSRRKLLGAKPKGLQVSDMVEIGPHPALRGPVRDIIQSEGKPKSLRYHALISRNSNAEIDFLTAIGRLFCIGYDVDLLAANRLGRGSRTLITNLPHYPFNHAHRHWIEGNPSRAYRFRKFAPNDLIGVLSPQSNSIQRQWRSFIYPQRLPWLKDHKIDGTCLFPGAGMLCMAIEAIKQINAGGNGMPAILFKNVSFDAVIPIDLYGDPVECHLSLQPLRHSCCQLTTELEFRVFTRRGEEWVGNCHGEISVSRCSHGLEELPYSLLGEAAPGDCVCGDRNLDHTDKDVATEDFYRRVEHGPAFKNLDQIRIAACGKLSAQLKLASPSTPGPQKVVPETFIHPTSLDAVFQLPLVAATIENPGAVCVVKSIRRLWIRSNMEGDQVPKEQPLTARSTRIGGRIISTDAAVLTPSTGSPFILVEGYKAFEAPPNVDAKQTSIPDNLCARMVWKPDADSNHRAESEDLAAQPQRVTYDRRLRKLLSERIISALAELESTDLEQVDKPYHRDYLTWLTRQAENITPSHLTANGYTDSEKPSGTYEEKLLISIADKLPDIIHGKVDPLQIMFRDNLAEQYYKEMLANGQYVSALQSHLQLMAHKNPQLRILEIGAGTGSATEVFLEGLTIDGALGCSRYDFTDISPAFFERARQRFEHAASRMNFATLDASKDPSSQGFDLGTYDIVIAADVLHALEDLPDALASIKQLLKPTGKMVLFEITNPLSIKAPLLFGLLPQWWSSIKDNAAMTPCYSVSGWDKALKSAGFTGVDLHLQDYHDADSQENSIMVSGVTADPSRSSSLKRAVLLVEKSNKSQAALLSNLITICRKFGLATETTTLSSVVDVQLTNDDLLVSLLEVHNHLLTELQPGNFLEVQKTLLRSRNLIWLTKEPSKSSQGSEVPKSHLIDGLRRVLSSENPSTKATTVHLESRTDFGSTKFMNAMEYIVHHFVESALDDVEPEFRVIEHVPHIGRVMKTPIWSNTVGSSQDPSLRLVKAKIRDLPALVMKPGMDIFASLTTTTSDLGTNEVIVRLQALGVQPNDYLISRYKVEATTYSLSGAGVVERAGIDCTVQPGEMVYVPGVEAFQSSIKCEESAVVRVPIEIPATDIAAVSHDFHQALFLLDHVVRLRRGQNVLITDPRSPFGKIVHRLVSTKGANVISLGESATAETSHARQAMSRSKQLKTQVGKRKIDVVVECSGASSIALSSTDVTPGGHYVCAAPESKFLTQIGSELAKRSVSITMLNFPQVLPHRRFESSVLFSGAMDLYKDALQHVTGSDSVEIWKPSRTKEALACAHDKAGTTYSVVSLFDEDEVQVPAQLYSPPLFNSAYTYVIAGGLGGLGRSLAVWMAEKGARHLLLLSRSGPKSEKARGLIARLEDMGCDVRAPICDITSQEQLAATINHVTETMPPLKGCIQATMVLRDTLLQNMTHEDWDLSIKPKVHGSWNLHRILPRNLDFFVMLSSITGIIGSISQGNYAAGNTFKDALARYRVSQGLKGSVLDVGMMVGEGVVAETDGMLDRLRRIGHFMDITQAQFFAAMEHLCDPAFVPATEDDCQMILGIETPESMLEKGIDLPRWAKSPTFRHFHTAQDHATAVEGDAASTSTQRAIDYASSIASADSEDVLAERVTSWLVGKLSSILGLGGSDIDTSRPIHTYGVDSLVGIELRNWIDRELGAEVSIFEIMGNKPLGEFSFLLGGRSRFRKAKA